MNSTPSRQLGLGAPEISLLPLIGPGPSTTTTTTTPIPTQTNTPNGSSAQGEDADTQNVRWTTELVMILVRNINQDKVTLQRLIEGEIAKSKQQGEVKESTIYQYINRIKRWAKGVYEADVRSGGIARRELQRDKKLTEAEEAAKVDFQTALKKEFKSMNFTPSHLMEIISLGKNLKIAEDDRQGDERRRSRIGGDDSGKDGESYSGKKKKMRSDDDAPPAPPLDVRVVATTVSAAVSQAMADFSKVAAKQNQDSANVIANAMQSFLQMQQQAEQKRLEREDKEREERRKERREERKLLIKLLGAKAAQELEHELEEEESN